MLIQTLRGLGSGHTLHVAPKCTPPTTAKLAVLWQNPNKIRQTAWVRKLRSFPAQNEKADWSDILSKSLFPRIDGDSKPKNFKSAFERQMLPRAHGKAKSEVSTSVSNSRLGPRGPFSMTCEGSWVGCQDLKPVADRTLGWPQATLLIYWPLSQGLGLLVGISPQTQTNK